MLHLNSSTMRTIRFRAKGKGLNAWYYGSLILRNSSDGEACAEIVAEDKGYYQFVDPETVGQATGTLDVNGKMIYEGDVVRYRLSDWRHKKNVRYVNAVVAWDEPEAGWGLAGFFKPEFWSPRLEVIGNVFDNPELVE